MATRQESACAGPTVKSIASSIATIRKATYVAEAAAVPERTVAFLTVGRNPFGMPPAIWE
jgi:hypothetical protein